MASKKKSLDGAKRDKKDEFYTQLEDIEKELAHYTQHFKGKTVFCNCDDPFESDFFKYFALNFNRLGLKKLIATCYSGSPITGTQFSLFDDTEAARRTPYKAIVTTVHDATGDGGINMLDVAELFRNGENKLEKLTENGDFRSDECIELLKDADIVVTNPPFSLFREFLSQLIRHNKKFLIIGNSNAITYKEVFPLLKENKMWLGVTRHGTGSMWFRVTDDFPVKTGQKIINGIRYQTIGNSAWFTNLEHKLRHEEMPLYKRYSSDEYPTYDNYDAIEVSQTSEIPCDYPGIMGVPITFLSKYNPAQFEIINLSRYLTDSRGMSKKFVDDYYDQGNTGQICEGHPDLCFYKNGKAVVPYMRVLIKNKHPES